jgi:RsiW-degrading membrane proteinase PrsW (M82 family)
MTLDLLIAAITPGLALLLILYIIDRKNKEPLGLLLKLFFLGMLICVPIIIIELALSFINPFGGLGFLAIDAFIVAGLTEEWFKRHVVLKHGYKHPAFDEKFDGIIYAVFVSLGFATLENVLYVVFSYQNIENLWMTRALFSVPGHMLFAITMGYYLAMAKYAPSKREERQFKRSALIYPMLFHGTFNFLLSLENIFYLLIFLGFVIFLWVINIIRLRKLYRQSKIKHIEKSYV